MVWTNKKFNPLSTILIIATTVQIVYVNSLSIKGLNGNLPSLRVPKACHPFNPGSVQTWRLFQSLLGKGALSFRMSSITRGGRDWGQKLKAAYKIWTGRCWILLLARPNLVWNACLKEGPDTPLFCRLRMLHHVCFLQGQIGLYIIASTFALRRVNSVKHLYPWDLRAFYYSNILCSQCLKIWNWQSTFLYL